MNKDQVFLCGLGLGAGLMYLFDPDRGRRRRALMRDQVVHALNASGDAISKTSRDLGNRASGLAARMSSWLQSDEVDDSVLVARVRARLGRLVFHPHAIEVRVHQGRVTLSGPVLASEVNPLLKGIASVRGVTEVENELQVYEQADHIPSLQGGKRRASGQLAWMQSNWSPTRRLLVSAAGGALALYGMRRRGVIGTAAEAAGLGLLVRGLTNLEMKDLIGLSGNRGIHIQKTININAPVERVFELWTQHENFPRFMSHVREVTDLGDGRYRWKVAGPAGISVEWEGMITKQIPNQMLAWESIPGSLIEQSGVVRFQPNEDGSTRLDVKLSYHPPAGMAGHLVARLFGADPKSELDADLLRMKAFIETGHQPHDAAEKKAAKREVAAS